MSQSPNDHSHEIPYISRQDKYTLIAPLLKQSWSVLLDSAGNDNQYNRYDILVFSPTVKLTFDGNKHSVESKDIELPALPQSPLKAMEAISQSIGASESSQNDNLPFNGGWLGYIGYDFARYLEKLPDETQDDIGLPQIQIGYYQWALITDHKDKTSRIYNFGLAGDQWQLILERVNESIQNTDKGELTDNFAITSDWISDLSKEDYFNRFQKIHDYIHAGDCYQVNLAQRFTANYQGDNYQAYQHLAKNNQAPFSAFMNYGEYQILSLSPERFIESHQGKVITQPIKGTRPRDEDPIQDQKNADALINSEKDRAENLMIVDLLRNDLSKTASKGSVKVTELFGHYKFNAVHHLISTIESQLADGKNNFDLLATCLPGGSITGAPKIRAMEIIEEMETYKRNIYCGVIAYIDQFGNMDSNICIRTLIAKENQLYCWAGGGLVAESEAEKEYQETFDKISRIIPLLNHISRKDD